MRAPIHTGGAEQPAQARSAKSTPLNTATLSDRDTKKDQDLLKKGEEDHKGRQARRLAGDTRRTDAS
jgi:hypothetical protein